jgi:hypothetical protein
VIDLLVIVTGELQVQLPLGIRTMSPLLAEFTADCTLLSVQFAASIVAASALAPTARNTTARISAIHPFLLIMGHLHSSKRVVFT